MQLGLESAQQMLRDAIPSAVKSVFGVPSTNALESLVGATQKGSPLADLFSGFGKEAADLTTKALVSGVTNGDNPRVIAKGVQDALGVSRQRALVITRNEALRCYKSAALETYRANDDVCGSWIWICDLSDRTCLACILLNGTEHPLSEDMQSHVCCRCSPSPKTRSFADILGDLGISSDSIEETSLSLPSGEDWFMQQSEETQKAIFNSNSAYDLWKSGDVSLQDFIGYNHDKAWGTSVRIKSVKELVK
jgi:SPP1 gp7 family putative phage head morphogenesis protein